MTGNFVTIDVIFDGLKSNKTHKKKRYDRPGHIKSNLVFSMINYLTY